MWEKGDHFGGFAGVAEGDEEVADGEDAEVAVEGVLAAEVDGGGTGAVESGDEFFTNGFGFSDSDDDDFSSGDEGCFESIDGAGEVRIEAVGESLKLGGLDSEDGACFLDQVHGGTVPEWADVVNPSKSGDLGRSPYSAGNR